MFKPSLIQTISSPETTSHIFINNSNKLIISKKNGDIDIYSKQSHHSFKFSQTYSKLLQNPTLLQQWYHSNELSIIIARYDNSLYFFNSTNLQLFDTIHDKRGIQNCWFINCNHSSSITHSPIVSSSSPPSDDQFIVFIYSMKLKARLRLIIWQNNSYKKMIELSLSNNKEKIISIDHSSQLGLIIVTNISIYYYSLTDNNTTLTKINTIWKKKIDSTDMIQSLQNLQDLTNVASNTTTLDNQSYLSIGRLSKKSSITNFWQRRHRITIPMANQLTSRFVFSNGNDVMVIDPISKNLLFLNHDVTLPSFTAKSHSQFVERNKDFNSIKLCFGNFLLLYNSQFIKIVDYKYGFNYGKFKLNNSNIKSVSILSNNLIAIYTENNDIQIIELKLVDCIMTNDLTSDELSIDYEEEEEEEDNDNDDDEEFIKLWKKVIFYTEFLNLSNYHLFLHNNNNNSSTSFEICAIKLRDLTVLWCLNIFDKLQSCLNVIHNQDSDPQIIQLQNIILSLIFENFIKFWAPPQLVILRTFPFNISNLVKFLTNQNFFTHIKISKISNQSLPLETVQKWIIPYLTDTRRHLKTLLQKDKSSRNGDGVIIWNYNSHSIEQSKDFFMMDDHDDVSLENLLKLIDTTLFLMYLNYIPSMVSTLMRVENSCDFKIVYDQLFERKMFKELLDFYYQHGEHEQALKFLIGLKSHLNDQDNYSSSNLQFQWSQNIQYLILNYLKQLPLSLLDIIINYANWLMENVKDDAKSNILKEIFLLRAENFSYQDQLKVYQYIDKFNSKLSLNFLEIVGAESKIINPNIHIKLIERYLFDFNNNDNNSMTKLKLNSFLRTNNKYNPETILKILQNYLNEGKIPKDQENSFKYLLISPLQRLGKHETSLDILYDQLNDFKTCSNYCLQILNSNSNSNNDNNDDDDDDDDDDGNGNDKNSQNVLLYFFQKIIDSYLLNNITTEIIFFLQIHGKNIDTITLLELIPKNFKLFDLSLTLFNSINKTSFQKDYSKLKQNLLQLELINISNDINQLSASYSILDETYSCPVCRKNFPIYTTGTILWFKIGHRNVATHYNCGKVLQNRINEKKKLTTHQNLKTIQSLRNQDNTA
ncbi:hypothetical protein TBLA_0C02080 [Henningerozyma blattae CBS 6284]|uniref:Vacuolar sorting protein 39/Transforming growth factor beta receptor-associated domain-containing protein n=1 Tax=Henningerozyma blattae (strain ATCC 34711 / CBS 6284 / DSM 70876 / NBRC 10599 / NRRL Y-10934 / UCD 77-7) TaxID=1071380 RepID=I2H0W8_HENB6|nr:hypothetical protein TBLA_0C02080 [Tetrapisispora blattae CBS 6284]CCH60020.1 hypothetical protein TBLA_0C02080 [Tetrapisispora blattae CBS 6284]